MDDRDFIEQVVEFHIDEYGLTENERCNQIEQRTYDLNCRPILFPFKNRTVETPSTLIDGVIYRFVNDVFKFTIEGMKIYILPLPLKGQKAVVYKSENTIVMVINEYEVLYSEWLFINILETLPAFGQLPNYANAWGSADIIGEIKKSLNINSLNDLALERAKLVQQIRHFKNEMPILKSIEGVIFPLVYPCLCSCESTAKNDAQEKFDLLFLPIVNGVLHPEQYHTVLNMMMGYLFCILAHEFSHVTYAHADGGRGRFAWDTINHKPQVELEYPIVEYEADVASWNYWKGFSDYHGIGQSDVLPYIGMYLCFATDYLRSSMEVFSKFGGEEALFYAWLGRILGYKQTDNSIKLFDSHPTELERFDYMAMMPVLCCTQVASKEVAEAFLNISAHLNVVFSDNVMSCSPESGYAVNCDVCKSDIPVHAGNMLINRIEKYNSLPSEAKSEIYSQFEKSFLNLDDLSIPLESGLKKKITSIQEAYRRSVNSER